MKKFLIILLLSIIYSHANTSGINSAIYLTNETIVSKPSFDKYATLYKAVRFVETKNGTILTSKASIKYDWKGELQISKELIDYCNEYLHCNYTYADRDDPIKSKEIFYKIQQTFNKKADFELGLHIWNAGPNYIEQRWHLTLDYRTKAKNYINSHV